MERPAKRPVPGRLIELSHQIRHGMATYPGLPGPELKAGARTGQERGDGT